MFALSVLVLSPEHEIRTATVRGRANECHLIHCAAGSAVPPQPGRDLRTRKETPGSLGSLIFREPPHTPEGYISAGPDGNIWFSEGIPVPMIGRITPAGVITNFGRPVTLLET